MAISPSNENDSQFTSFANPNYQLHEEELNCDQKQNTFSSNIYEDVETLSSESGSGPSTPRHGSTKRRKKYAHMDLMSMGIDPNKDPVSEMKKGSPLKNSEEHETVWDEEDDLYASIDVSNLRDAISEAEEESNSSIDQNDYPVTSSITEKEAKVTDSFLSYYASLEESLRKRREEEGCRSSDEEQDEQKQPTNPLDVKLKGVNSPDSNDSGIQADQGVQHFRGPVNDDIYAVVSRPPKSDTLLRPDNMIKDEMSECEVLPPGWEKHSDADGPYYWHVKSGTIQRQAPPHCEEVKQPQVDQHVLGRSCETSSMNQTSTSAHLIEFEGHAVKYAAESLKTLQRVEETKGSEGIESTEKPVRYPVKSLGWVPISEEDLTSERSSKAVNKCIVDLSHGRNDINDGVGRWGDGKDLYMDLDSCSLRLIDPQDFNVLNSQSIQSIRVWGVGRDNGRDFAYVARDKLTHIHMCHVFRCETPARHIANTLKEICKQIMLGRTGNMTTSLDESSSIATSSGHKHRVAASRPTNLPNLEKAGQQHADNIAKVYRSFPTPMEEPKKTIKGHYLGTMVVHKPTGVDILNAAIERMYAKVPKDRWTFVNVAVAPSTITISEHGNPDKVVDECRVRFLSFLGIAVSNVKMCAFIMHSAEDQFVAHVFHCEPSAGALCKTIEAACKLRYQKCLDSHAATPDTKKQAVKQTQPIAANDNGRRDKLGYLGNHLKQGMHNVLEAAISKARKWKS